jgi:hypothetical protein
MNEPFDSTMYDSSPRRLRQSAIYNLQSEMPSDLGALHRRFCIVTSAILQFDICILQFELAGAAR